MEIEHFFIKNAKVSDIFSGIYFIENIYERVAKNGKTYTDFILRDKSGSSLVRHWGVLEGVAKKGTWLHVSIKVEEYQGQPQLIMESGEPVDQPIEMGNYISISSTLEKDIETFHKIVKLIEDLSIKAKIPLCFNLIKHVFKDEFLSNFFNAPFSTTPYYGCKGGLLAHTIKIAWLANETGKLYQLSNKERVILLTSCLLHAVGVLDGYSMESLLPTENKVSLIMGKTNLSIMALERILSSIGIENEEDKDTALRIRHCVAVCGYNAVKPMTKESVILAQSCSTDFHIVEAIDSITQDSSSDEITTTSPNLKRRFVK